MESGILDTYWTETETFEALKIYIDMNFSGLRDTVVKLMAGGRQKIDTRSFVNDMTTFHSADDVLTLLVHLGYLGYDFDTKEVFIPNREIMGEYVTATRVSQWSEIIHRNYSFRAAVGQASPGYVERRRRSRSERHGGSALKYVPPAV